MSGLIIDVGHQTEGSAFELAPESRALLDGKYPERQKVASVYLSYGSQQDLKEIPKATWRHVVQLLTGLEETEIAKLGGFMLAEPFTGNRVYESWNTTNLAA